MSAAEAVERFRAAVAATQRPEAWIHVVDGDVLAARAREVDAAVAAGADLALAGVLVAVKDNIDVAGCPTTAAAPTYAYEPAVDAPAVQRLREAGAIIVGKTNMDQFATGLVGTRSPYGAVRHASDATRISGGSSSGSAVAVAQGLVDLALGTDTAGSGRVPAALHGIWGIKPTRGLVPTTGVVPACASLDCVTVFGRDPELAALALEVMSGPDQHDPLSQRPADVPSLPSAARTRLVVPTRRDLGELAPGWQQAFEQVVEVARQAGYVVVERSIAPLLDAARMLYESSFVAERYSAVGSHLEDHRDAIGGDLDPTVAGIVLAGAHHSAADLFADQRTLERYRSAARELLADAVAVLTPTTTWHPTLDQVAADPVGANSRMGRFTNFANQLDMAAVALPAGKVAGGGGAEEFGAMLTGHAFSDARLLAVAQRLVAAVAGDVSTPVAEAPEPDEVDIFVVGAHRTGEPLNGLITTRGGRLMRATTTAPAYRLYALAGHTRPGMVLADEPGGLAGAPIVGEVWRLPLAGFGAVVAEIPTPLGVGAVALADGTTVTGFLCQQAATRDCTDLTEVGDWVVWRRQMHASGM